MTFFDFFQALAAKRAPSVLVRLQPAAPAAHYQNKPICPISKVDLDFASHQQLVVRRQK